MEYFMAVAESGSITQAARQLQTSKQALSNSIARLEAELGCRLFERRHGLELTYGGRKYLESVAKILDIHRQTSELLDDISGNVRGELRIGISYTRGQALLPLVLPSFIEQYPLVELSVLEGNTRALEEHLAHGDLDLMIGTAPFMFEGAEFVPLMRERLHLVVPKTLLAARFGSAERAEARLDEFRRSRDLGLFRDFPFVLLKEGDRLRSIADALFARSGVRPFIKFGTRNIQTAVALAAEGVGVTLCPELYLRTNYIAAGAEDSYIRRRVEILPLTDEADSDFIAVGYDRGRYQSDIAASFIRLCVACVERP